MYCKIIKFSNDIMTLNHIHTHIHRFLKLSQIYDASTNTWKVVDERTHTDFSEKIVEHPPTIVYVDRDDISETTIRHNEHDHTESLTNISNTTNILNERLDVTNLVGIFFISLLFLVFIYFASLVNRCALFFFSLLCVCLLLFYLPLIEL